MPPTRGSITAPAPFSSPPLGAICLRVAWTRPFAWDRDAWLHHVFVSRFATDLLFGHTRNTVCHHVVCIAALLLCAIADHDDVLLSYTLTQGIAELTQPFLLFHALRRTRRSCLLLLASFAAVRLPLYTVLLATSASDPRL